jgi:glycerophosphoryl diester phosphodiesterase
MRACAGTSSVKLPGMQGKPSPARARPEAPQRPPLRKIGHKGADLIEPGNTPASFDAALAHGVDMIELDVLPERGSGRLVLAHDYEDAARREPLALDQGLAHLASEPFESVEFIVDLKLPGYELRVLEALSGVGLRQRSIISSQFRQSLVRIRGADPEVRLGWSVPKARRDYTRSPFLAGPAYAALRLMRITLPRRAGDALRAGLCNAIIAHWRLVTTRLVAAVRMAEGELYAWTVDDAARIRALANLGVTGVITNDPRLFTTDPA